ncbi:hypothetical protein [Streptomyces violascens]|uniref:Protein kilB n=1 Tax=Streptomyces violascens TaxID=67381 RepID=A0ABQ3QS05_9ACTN|nr:hypothetical protein [Streptomyces violascens]GHI40070.1 hypothetical protein Sviol_44780 [Streptomyces violascens]
MLATIVAVVGTLLGSIVTGVFQHLASGRTERAAAAQQLRQDQLDAITNLAAGADYRRIMRKRGQARLNQASKARQEQLRHESHVIRSTLTQPMTALKVLIPDPRIHAAARAMVQAAYSIRDSADADALNTAQEAACLAHDDFVNAATQYVTGSAGRETRIARDSLGLPGSDPTPNS